MGVSKRHSTLYYVLNSNESTGLDVFVQMYVPGRRRRVRYHKVNYILKAETE